MIKATWQKIEKLFNSASELPAADRLSFLKQSCNDGGLRKEVHTLLYEMDKDFPFLEGNISSEIISLLAKNESNFCLLEKDESLSTSQGAALGALQSCD